LLSIATRKAGTEIDCPKCQERLIVPPPVEYEPVSVSAASQQRPRTQTAPNPTSYRDLPLFENPEFEQIFDQPAPEVRRRSQPEVTSEQPILVSATPRESGITLSHGTAAILATLTLLLLMLCFLAGYLVGRS
jgi:hypothetical protein